MTVPDPEWLRAQALDALGPYGDERVREALVDAELTVEPDARVWEASTGTMRAHRVVLHLDEALLATVRATPAVEDGLAAAIAAALARRSGETLDELILRPTVVPPSSTPYRGRTPR
jgi:hypothetical protein